MFGFLKEKLKSAFSKFAKKSEDEIEQNEIEQKEEDKKITEELLSEETVKFEKTSKKENRAKKDAEENSEEATEEATEENTKKIVNNFVKEEVKEKIGEINKEKTFQKTENDNAKKGIKKSAEKDNFATEKNKFEGKFEVNEQEKSGLFTRLLKKITDTTLDEKTFNELFNEIEFAFLESNVAVEVIEKIKNDLHSAIVGKTFTKGKLETAVHEALKQSLQELFNVPSINLIEKSNEKKPLVICFFGINGGGKTTTIAKLAKLFQNNGKSVVLAAGDTFRAAAIEQLEIHANALGIKIIKHDYGADSAAVAFDAIAHAKASGKDAVLIDTAGRLHSNANLMEEMKKIVRVAKPDIKIFIGESIAGNDCIEQAQKFDELVGIDGIILSKADIDDKGGASLSITYVTKKPILYLGVGQEYDDLESFNANKIIDALGV